ncbi:hypothetical protein hmeg3_09630 [Herbaspirillum sp. meg3]|nr:hypothetical protein hmeg3_09630 [Herbaspirillum sp. meg3]
MAYGPANWPAFWTWILTVYICVVMWFWGADAVRSVCSRLGITNDSVEIIQLAITAGLIIGIRSLYKQLFAWKKEREEKNGQAPISRRALWSFFVVLWAGIFVNMFTGFSMLYVWLISFAVLISLSIYDRKKSKGK